MQAGVTIEVRNGVVWRLEPDDVGADSASNVPTIDCAARLVIPPYANIHHHFYSALLRGAPLLRHPATNQQERLERLVWPFDRSLDRQDVRAAVRLSLLEAVAAGTTTVVDHHTSGGCLDGILDLIAEEVSASGLRGVLCYEICDRDGHQVTAGALRESERFLKSLPGRGDHIRGMVGLHAMSTISPETLEKAAGLAEAFGVGIHVHVGENEEDNAISLARFGGRPVARLQAAGALSPRTILAHVVYVTAEEIDMLAEHDPSLAYNPRSNALNGLGVADVPAFQTAGLTVGVGGDGFTQDIRTELSLVPVLQRQHRHDPSILGPAEAVQIGMAGNATIVERVSGWRVGSVAPGLQADLAVLDYDPAVPVESHNALWHVANGFPGARIRDVFVAGAPVLRDGEHVTLDAERIRQESQPHIAAIWSHVASL